MGLNPSDLAPGDKPSASFDWSGLALHAISSEEDPHFETVYGELWAEFGAKGELEEKEVLRKRLSWNPACSEAGYSMAYEMILVHRGSMFVAARDHTAIVSHEARRAIVHLSHVLIEPDFRGSGLSGWLRALPVGKAQACLKAAGFKPDSPITLVAEMESLSEKDPSTRARLRSYEKAGFKMMDPSKLHYLQPDFRSPKEIDQSGGPKPLPLCLVVRRVGRESENEISGKEAAEIIQGLYAMYARSFRQQDMKAVWDHLKSKGSPKDERIALVPPLGVRPSQEKP